MTAPASQPPAAPAELRPLAEAELPILRQLIADLAEFENLSHQLTATPEELQAAFFGPQPKAQAVLAWQNGTAVGFAVWYETFSTFRGRTGIYVEDLFVQPAFRSSGIGRQLLAYVANEAVRQNCFRLEWEVLRWNEQAIGFYRSLEAHRDEDWDVYTLTGDPLKKLAESSQTG